MLTFKNSNMSLPESNDGNKIAPVDNSESNKEGGMYKLKHKPVSLQYDGIFLQENHGAVPKVVGLNNKSGEEATIDLASKIEGLLLSADSSDDTLCKTDWLKVRDSLENLLSTKSDKAGLDISNSKSTSCTTSKDKDKLSIGDSPHSESLIGGKSSCTHSVSKVLSWDPWDKLGRKSKKENKKRKYDKPTENTATTSTQDQRKDFKSGDEAGVASSDNLHGSDSQGYMENYEYQPYQPKNSRSVEFTNKVMVVYIKEDKVIGEATEPLKKELDQQIRNKEMRKGHMLDIPFLKKRLVNDWFKK